MKKNLIIALGAIALVACTKTSVSYEQTGEIGFAPVVRKNSTKAAVQGVLFDPSWSIKVFGYYDNSVGKENEYTAGKLSLPKKLTAVLGQVRSTHIIGQRLVLCFLPVMHRLVLQELPMIWLPINSLLQNSNSLIFRPPLIFFMLAMASLYWAKLFQ